MTLKIAEYWAKWGIPVPYCIPTQAEMVKYKNAGFNAIMIT